MGIPQGPDTPPAPPILFADIDGALLLRVHPFGLSTIEGPAVEAALAAGRAAYEAGKTLVAGQQEPLPTNGEPDAMSGQPQPTQPTQPPTPAPEPTPPPPPPVEEQPPA